MEELKSTETSNPNINTPTESKSGHPKGLSSGLSTSSGENSNESSRRNSLTDKEIERNVLTMYPRHIVDHRIGRHGFTERKIRRNPSGKLRLEPNEFSVEEVHEEFEAEKERLHRVPRVRLVNDFGETIPPQWGKDPVKRCCSVDYGVLFRVDETTGEEDVRRKIHNKPNLRFLISDKDEFNLSKEHHSAKLNQTPAAVGFRRPQSMFFESEEVIEEDMARESKETDFRRPKLLTPTNRKTSFGRVLKVDELESKSEKRIAISGLLDESSPVKEDIEEEKMEDKGIAAQKLSAGFAIQKGILQKLIKGEQMGEWDIQPLEYLNREHSHTIKTNTSEIIEELPLNTNNGDYPEDKD